MPRSRPVWSTVWMLSAAAAVATAAGGCAPSSSGDGSGGGRSGRAGGGTGGAQPGGTGGAQPGGAGGVAVGSGGSAPGTGGTGAPGTGGGGPGTGGAGMSTGGGPGTGGAGMGTGGGTGAGGAGMGTGGAPGTGGTGMSTGGTGMAARGLEDLQRSYIDLRFGMFIHFGILTYTGAWSQANLPIAMFNPTTLNPAQWADAAVAAKMKYAVLTTKHHDGFALWNSAVSTFDVGSIPWRGGQGDVVREYVNAFRAKGLLPGLYYSVWDNTQGTGNGTVTRAQIDYVKAQLTELLTGYGDIPIIIFDGWSWKMGHKAMPYQEIRALVKSLQPNCLMLDHTHFMSPWDADIAGIEEPKGAFVPADNTFPATQGQKINASGGNDWFWSPTIGGLMTVDNIVNGHLRMLEPRWTTFLLNCPPNRDGLMPAEIVTRLAEVGAAWSPNAARPVLPAQGPQNEFPYTPTGATADSGTAVNAIDGINDWGYFTVWQTTSPLPQSITLDLGQARPDVGFLGYVPRYVANMGPSTDGAITSYLISTSTDGTNFTMATMGTWPANGKMKAAAFGPVMARYVRLQARAVMGTAAAATEITVGARR